MDCFTDAHGTRTDTFCSKCIKCTFYHHFHSPRPFVLDNFHQKCTHTPRIKVNKNRRVEEENKLVRMNCLLRCVSSDSDHITATDIEFRFICSHRTGLWSKKIAVFLLFIENRFHLNVNENASASKFSSMHNWKQ